MTPSIKFIYNNILIYTVYKVSKWLQDNTIDQINQSLYSLDLNLIEYIQYLLKERLYKDFPRLLEIDKLQIDINYFINCINRVWELIEQDTIDTLINSIPRRLVAVQKAKGQQTQYQISKTLSIVYISRIYSFRTSF